MSAGAGTPGVPGAVPPEKAAHDLLTPGPALPIGADVALKAEEAEKEKNTATVKALNDRIAQLEDLVKQNTRQPSITPVILKSGVKSDATAADIVNKIYLAQENAELTSESAEISKSLVDRFRAAANGHIAFSIVEQQLNQAPADVRRFFSGLNVQASA
jgi:ethanolamine utilization microcompartment shell protein EutS